ncbi:MAG: CBS domain-containing protein [Bacteroidota bacterium]|nr:CBS domain-containing protein [Bacteroidota bacterium]
MNTKKLISQEIQPLTLESTGSQALSMMIEFHLSHMVVVEKGRLLGVIAEEDIWNMYDENNKIKTISDKIAPLHMPIGKDVFEIIKYMNEKNLSLLPILVDNKYKGVITHKSVIEALASIEAIKESGGVIILEMNKKDYSMSEISQIVESNNAKILSSYVIDVDEKNIMKLTIKLNVMDIAPIIQTFERYKYTISASFNHSENSDDLSDRFDMFMRYLNP